MHSHMEADLDFFNCTTLTWTGLSICMTISICWQLSTQSLICQGLKKQVLLERDLIPLKATRVARVQAGVCDSAERSFARRSNIQLHTLTPKTFRLLDVLDAHQWLALCRRSSRWRFPHSF